MDVQTVQEVVRVLKSKGERVSVRSVHAVTGGSFRDVSRLLRDVRELLDEDEAAELEAEAPELLTPSIGDIARTAESLAAVSADIDRASRKLYDTRELLRVLHAQRPPPAVDPDDV